MSDTHQTMVKNEKRMVCWVWGLSHNYSKFVIYIPRYLELCIYIYVMHIFMDTGEYMFLDLHTLRYVQHVGI